MWLSVVQDRNLKSRYEGGFRTNHEATEQAAYLELLADFFDSDVLDAAIVANHHDPEDVELENLTTERLKEIVESCFEDRYPRADWVIYDHDISSQFLADELAKQLGKT